MMTRLFGAGPVVERTVRPWSKAETIACALSAAGVLASLLVLVHPWYDLRNDASVYLVTARALAEGRGYTYVGAPFLIHPPGFSAMIACVVALVGVNFLACNLLVSVFGAAGVALLYLHQRTRVGWGLGLMTAAAVWLNPGYQRLCNQVMSDVPGIALLFACLLLERWASRAPSWGRELLLGLCIGLSAYVRAATLLVLPAIVVARILARLCGGEEVEGWSRFAARRIAMCALAAWAALLPWSVYQARHAPQPPADQTPNYSISTGMWHKDPGDPRSPRFGASEILARAPLNVRAVSAVLGSRLNLQVPGPPPQSGKEMGFAALAIVLSGCLLVVALQRRSPAEIFALGMLGFLAFYFTFTDRLVLPVYVIMVAAAVDVLGQILRRVARARGAAAGGAAAFLLLILMDFGGRGERANIERRQRSYEEFASAVQPRLEPDARLASARGFHYSVFLNRPVYSLIHAVRREGRIEAVEEVIDKYGINTIVLSPPLDPEDRAFLTYLRQHYGSGLPAGPAVVWRVRPRPVPDRPEER